MDPRFSGPGLSIPDGIVGICLSAKKDENDKHYNHRSFADWGI
jgi:hypothetical protein